MDYLVGWDRILRARRVVSWRIEYTNSLFNNFGAVFMTGVDNLP